MAGRRARGVLVSAAVVVLAAASATAGHWQKIPHRAGEKLEWAPVPGVARYFVEDLETGGGVETAGTEFPLDAGLSPEERHARCRVWAEFPNEGPLRRVLRHSFSPRTGESRVEFVAPFTAPGAMRVVVKSRVGEGGRNVRNQ